MKMKILSALLCGCLLISLLSTVVYGGIDDLPEGFYTDFTLANGEKIDETVNASNYKHVYALLKYLNIINNDEILPQNKASRGFAAHVFAGVASGGNLIEALEKPFSDVQLNSEYISGISTALAFGIVDPSERFLPENNVTLEELADMALRCLGYKKELAVQYPYAKAVSLKLFSGIDTGKETFSMGDVMLMAVNTLESQKFSMKSVISGGGYTVTEEGQSMLEDLGIYLVKGIVTAQNLLSIYGETSSLGEDKIQINRKNYFLAMPADDLFGKAVYAYCDSKSDDLIITVFENSVLTQSTVVKFEEVIRVEQSSIRFLDDNNETTQSISPSAKVIVNFMPASAMNPALFADYDELELIDNNADGETDVICIKNFSYYSVKAVSPYTGTITNKHGKGSLNIDEQDKNTILRKNGVKIGLHDITKDNVLKVTESVYGGETRRVIDVSERFIQGTLQTISEAEQTFEVDNVIFDLTDEYLEFFTGTQNSEEARPELGDMATFYLSDDGKIVDSVVGAAYEYGYLMGVDTGKGLEEKCTLKLYSIDYRVQTYDLSDQVTLYTPTPSSGTFYSVQYGATPMEVYNALVSGEEYTTEMIAYQLDVNGKIKFIATEYNYLSKEPLKTDYPLVKNYMTGYPGLSDNEFSGWFYMRILANIYNVPAETPIIRVSNFNSTKSERMNETFYTRWGGSTDEQFSNNYLEGESLTLYNVNSVGRAEFAVYRNTVLNSGAGAVVGGYNDAVMISSKSVALTEDGEEVIKLGYMLNGSEMFVNMKMDAEFSYENESSAGYYGKPEKPTDVAVGDIIQYEVDAYGLIHAVRVLFRESDRGEYRTQTGTDTVSSSFTGKPFEYLAISYGKVIEAQGDSMMVNMSSNGDPQYSANYFVTNTRSGVHGSNTYTLFNSKNKKVQTVTADEIQEGDEVVMRSDYNIVVDVFIYR